MLIKSIFFDLDHTVWDFEKNSELSFKKIFKKYTITCFSKGTKVGIINRTQWFGLNYGLNSQFFFIDNYFGDDA